MTKRLSDPTPVGREGNSFLLAKKSDIAAGNKSGMAQVHHLGDNPPWLTETKPLQVWFKWANWDDTTQQEYDAELKKRGL